MVSIVIEYKLDKFAFETLDQFKLLLKRELLNQGLNDSAGELVLRKLNEILHDDILYVSAFFNVAVLNKWLHDIVAERVHHDRDDAFTLENFFFEQIFLLLCSVLDPLLDIHGAFFALRQLVEEASEAEQTFARIELFAGLFLDIGDYLLGLLLLAAGGFGAALRALIRGSVGVAV
jgi:hypothetical protein